MKRLPAITRNLLAGVMIVGFSSIFFFAPVRSWVLNRLAPYKRPPTQVEIAEGRKNWDQFEQAYLARDAVAMRALFWKPVYCSASIDAHGIVVYGSEISAKDSGSPSRIPCRFMLTPETKSIGDYHGAGTTRRIYGALRDYDSGTGTVIIDPIYEEGDAPL